MMRKKKKMETFKIYRILTEETRYIYLDGMIFFYNDAYVIKIFKKGEMKPINNVSISFKCVIFTS